MTTFKSLEYIATMDQPVCTNVPDVVKAFGGPRAVANVFGFKSTGTVSNWQKWGRFPDYLHMRIYVEAQKRGIRIAPELVGMPPESTRDEPCGTVHLEAAE